MYPIAKHNNVLPHCLNYDTSCKRNICSMQAGKEVPCRNSMRQAGKQMNENQPKEQ